MKEEALKLADELDNLPKEASAYWTKDSSAMIRRLVEELDKQELNGGGFPVKNATYWKRQYNLMSAQNDRLKSGIYHANEQIKYLESLAPQTKPLSNDEYEKIMQQWDYWRKQIADGDTSSAPRDWFESILEFARLIEERHGIK